MDLGFMGSLRGVAATRFRSTCEVDAAELLVDCLRTAEPVVVLTGAAGLGKTTVLDMALEQVGDSGPRVLRLAPPFPTPLGLQRLLAELLDLDGTSTAPAELARALRALRAPAAGLASLAVIVDQAEAVPLPLLQYLWLMHTVAGATPPALQLVLIGRDALWRQLGDERLAGLRRSVTARLAMQPFPPDEAAEFLHYLLRARRRRAVPDAIEKLLSSAAGVPGRLVTLLDTAEAGLASHRAITLLPIRAASSDSPAIATPAGAGRSGWARASGPRSLRLRKLRPLQLGMALAGVILSVAAWRLLDGISSSPSHVYQRDRVQGLAAPVRSELQASPVSPIRPWKSSAGLAAVASQRAPSASLAGPMLELSALETEAASLGTASARAGRLLGGFVRVADASLARLILPPPAREAMPPAHPAAESGNDQARLQARLRELTMKLPCSWVKAELDGSTQIRVSGVTALGEASALEMGALVRRSIAQVAPARLVDWKVSRISGLHCAVLNALATRPADDTPKDQLPVLRQAVARLDGRGTAVRTDVVGSNPILSK